MAYASFADHSVLIIVFDFISLKVKAYTNIISRNNKVFKKFKRNCAKEALDLRLIKIYNSPNQKEARLCCINRVFFLIHVKEGQKMDSILEQARRRIILPLDYAKLSEAVVTMVETRHLITEYKVGLTAITAGFAQTLAQIIHELGPYVGWDGKWDDIPETVKGASNALMSLGTAKWCNVHASAGPKSVEAAVKACHSFNSLRVYGVTVLTSIEPDDCISYFGGKPNEKVWQFAKMLVDKGADGVICSPKEIEFLGQHPELNNLWKVTPGVRPAWASANDQKRVMTPFDAICAGADYLVIGRPITKPPAEIGTPEQAVNKIADEMAAAIEIRISAGTWKED